MLLYFNRYLYTSYQKLIRRLWLGDEFMKVKDDQTTTMGLFKTALKKVLEIDMKIFRKFNEINLFN